ncbi:hypothetical protein TMatcc_009410 [Talaromyces marneffei ATCC 18224]
MPNPEHHPFEPLQHSKEDSDDPIHEIILLSLSFKKHIHFINSRRCCSATACAVNVFPRPEAPLTTTSNHSPVILTEGSRTTLYPFQVQYHRIVDPPRYLGESSRLPRSVTGGIHNFVRLKKKPENGTCRPYHWLITPQDDGFCVLENDSQDVLEIRRFDVNTGRLLSIPICQGSVKGHDKPGQAVPISNRSTST